MLRLSSKSGAVKADLSEIEVEGSGLSNKPVICSVQHHLYRLFPLEFVAEI